VTATLETTARLLVAPSERAPGLAGHLARHGPLAVPPGTDRHWSASVLRCLAEARLAGRGGAGFPTAAKWSTFRGDDARPLVVVDAMEGEPASGKDRVLLEAAPHLVLDGAQVAAAVIGAPEVVVCVPADDDRAAAAVRAATAERASVVARHGPRITLERPPRRYVGGEESALGSWLDGRDGLPAFRTDKSTPLTVRGRSALVHNPETLAQVALLVRHGAEWFRLAGTPSAPGTTLVTVSGAVHAPGVLEVEFGTPLADVVTATGIDAPPRALLVGGYAGTWIAPEDAATPYAPDALREVGGVLGAGVVVVLGAGSCGVAETARLVRFMAGESAGQCGPCVFGLAALADDLERLWAGHATPGLLERIARRASVVEGRGACRHPDGVVRVVRSALEVFSDDVAAHAAGRPCAAHRAPTVLTFPATRTALPGRLPPGGRAP
jgi:NADH:ubiquinone oxidoreductase subunit F (NADH-binding)